MHLNLGEKYLVDRSTQTSAEELADGKFILLRDIRKALDGQDFRFYESGGGKPLDAVGINEHDRGHYYMLFTTCEKFGLPHGKGWINEQPWLIDFLGFMKNVYSAVEYWKASKSGSGGLSRQDTGI